MRHLSGVHGTSGANVETRTILHVLLITAAADSEGIPSWELGQAWEAIKVGIGGARSDRITSCSLAT